MSNVGSGQSARMEFEHCRNGQIITEGFQETFGNRTDVYTVNNVTKEVITFTVHTNNGKHTMSSRKVSKNPLKFGWVKFKLKIYKMLREV